jgi:hypothetical protein
VCYSLRMRDQVLHSYKTVFKITVLYMSVFMFLDNIFEGFFSYIYVIIFSCILVAIHKHICCFLPLTSLLTSIRTFLWWELILLPVTSSSS